MASIKLSVALVIILAIVGTHMINGEQCQATWHILFCKTILCEVLCRSSRGVLAKGQCMPHGVCQCTWNCHP
ncbi:unnamed protein product [Lactuca virosa]|uniref:Uncharacterized protein n=1 Tax=Lactuca virosa TaxID=75947 RepID=A0AAU9NXB6_9ASTR|nr:unnamed protein product [Lactuca virosa]